MMATRNNWDGRDNSIGIFDAEILENALEILLEDPDEINYEESLPSPSSIGSSNTSNTSHENYKKKSSRPPPFRVNFIPQLRILKRDIRRKYMSILCNVINSHDENLFSRFLADLASPDCYFQLHFTQLGLHLTLGIEDMKHVFFLLLECSPDFIFGITSAQIYQRLHEFGSRIGGHYSFEGILLYLFSGMQASLSSFLSYSYQMTGVTSGHLYPLQYPLTIQSEGNIILHLDEHRRLIAIEAEVC